MGLRLLRILAAAAAVVAILGLALVALLHLAPVRSRALSWVVAELATRYDLLLTADRLSYNLLTGSVTLTDVRLAARGFADQPFFAATRVRADVPLAAYAGRLILDDVAVEAGRLTIVTDAQGRSNLPAGGDAPPPAEPRALALGGLHLRDFALLYDDRQTPMRISATGIEAALDDRGAHVFAGATGPFAVRGGVDVGWHDRALRVEPFESRLGFDGRNVSVEDLRVVTTMGRLSVSGTLHRVLDSLSLELGFDGEVDLARAVEWAPPPVPVAGTTRVRGTINGPTNAIELVTRFDAPSLSVGAEPELTAGGEILIDRTRLIANRLIVSPHSGGEIHAALDLPFADAPFSLTAAWQGVDARVLMRLANVTPQPIATRLDGEAKFTSGSARALTLKTDLAAVQERGATPLAGEIEASLKGDDWSVTHDLRADGVTVTGRAEGQLDAEHAGDSTIAGPSTVVIQSLEAADRTLAPLGVRVPEAIRGSEGAIEAEAAIGGTFSNPRGTVVAHAPAFDLPGVGPTALDATIDVDRRAVLISPFTARRDGTEASGDVSIDLTSRSLGGTLHVTIPDALVLQADLPEQWRVAGALDADVWLMGTLDAPAIESWVSGPTLVFAGDTYTDLQGGIAFSNRTLSTTGLRLDKDDGQLAVRGQVGLDRTFQAEIDATNLSWSRVIVGETPSRLGLDGRFSGSGSLDRPVGEGTFGFRMTGGVAGDLVGEGTLTAALTGDLARLTVVEPGKALFASGTVALASPYEYRAVGVINQLDIAKLVPLLEVEPGQITGQLNATAAVTGAINGDVPPTVEANIQQIDARVAGVPFTLVAPAAVGWQPGELTVRNFTASLGSGTLTAEGAWGERASTVFSGSYHGDIAELAAAGRAFGVDETLSLRGWMVGQVYATGNRQDLVASVAITGGHLEPAEGLVFSNLNTVAGLQGENLTLHSLTGRVDAERAGGSFAGKGEATIPGLDPMRAVGRFALDAATFDSAGLEVKQTRPTTISIDNGLVTMDDVVWEAAGSQLALGGSVDLSGGSPALNLSVEGTAVLRALSAFSPRLGVDGTAAVDVRVGGTAASPDLEGAITLDNAEIALASPRIVISELSGPIALSGNRIELRGLRGSANGGSLTIDGGFLLRGTEIADGEVYVQAAGIAVEYPPGLRSEVDALLTYDVGGATPVLSGDVRVQRAAYTQPISLAALARANAGAVRTLNQESTLEQLRLNVTVTTVEDIRVDNNYGRFEGGAQLRIVGTAAQPGMSGQVTLREGGQIYAVGRTFRLERGTISFTDLNRIRPDLDIRAITRVSNLGDVTMSLQGTPDRLEFDLTSEEDASREEIAQALLGGGATGANALALLSGDLLGVTGRQLGLDALRIQQGEVVRDEFREDPSAIAQDDANPVTRLTLSKRLRDNVEFTLSQNLAENGKTTFLISYYPLSDLELRAISRDDGTQGVGVRHQIAFGGDPARQTAAPREEVKVAAVRLEGSFAPFTEEEIRGDLKVSAGETLNFYEWQRDLDDLTARYVRRGHYEVRVRGRRDPAGEGAVTVIYSVVPGPATRIRVDGLDVPDEDLEAIQQSWSRGVFDRFIVQDAEARVHQRLLTRGFVNGVVTGTMESSEGAKTLHLTVVPGTEAGSRGMRFIGNAGVSRNELEAVVQQTGMEVTGWIDRGGLEQNLTTWYRNNGYLGATVSVGEPFVEDGRGVLPVTIEEGPRATIREVHWSGVSEARAAEMRKIASLEPGAPYTLAALDGARERIDRRYRTLGHNAVEVSATGAPVDDNQQQVDVKLAIVEGPEQVLQNVETVGATRTREGIVSRALRLPVGRPVDLEEWALARKRLFDTNVFRSVDIQAVPLGEPVNGVQQVQALVTVEEYPPWRFRYGFQADRNRDDSSPEALESAPPEITYGGIAEIRNQNLFGRAVTGGVAARVELDFQRVNTFVQTASFFGLPFRSGLFVYASRERVREDNAPLFIQEIGGVSFEQRWRRRRGFEITGSYRFERSHFYDPEPPPGESFPFDQVLNDGRLTGAFLWDRRDDPVNASRGTFSSVSLERAAPWLASDTSYTRYLVQQTGYLKTGPVVLAGRVMAGRAWGSDIPPDQRFLAGGGTTVRGYGENVLGPRNDILGSIGGTELLILNQEARFPLYRWFRGVGFLDVGNTFDRTYPFSWSEIKIGYGAGLRLDSPIGLLRLDFGIPGSTIPNSGRQPNTFSSGRWYFGIGHVF